MHVPHALGSCGVLNMHYESASGCSRRLQLSGPWAVQCPALGLPSSYSRGCQSCQNNGFSPILDCLVYVQARDGVAGHVALRAHHLRMVRATVMDVDTVEI
jgi:hypothetical protein